MNPYYNLPPEQGRVQRLVDQFNADEELRGRLEAKRVIRRIRYPRLSRTHRKLFDLLDLVFTRPLYDCIGFFKRR